MFYRQFKTGKYGNVKSEYNGRLYHSGFEAEVARDLDLARRATEPRDRVVEVIPQYRVELKVNGWKICDYYVDFYVKYADGREALVEAKGFQTETWRLKWKLLEAIWGKERPDVELRVVQQKQQWRKFASRYKTRRK